MVNKIILVSFKRSAMA